MNEPSAVGGLALNKADGHAAKNPDQNVPVSSNWSDKSNPAGSVASGGATNGNIQQSGSAPAFYSAPSGSVISGPPLLGGSNVGNIGGPRMTGLPSFDYALGQAPHDGSTLTNKTAHASDELSVSNHAPEVAQRSQSGNFTGYLYAHVPSGNPNAGSTIPNLQSGGMMTSHIDFMNINNSPPLLSGGSQAIYLGGLGSKAGDGMNLMGHGGLYSGMHGILPMPAGGYANMPAYNGGNMDAMATAVGGKRSAGAAGAGGATKKVKAAAGRGRAASYSAASPVVDAARGAAPPGDATSGTSAAAAPTQYASLQPAMTAEGQDPTAAAPPGAVRPSLQPSAGPSGPATASTAQGGEIVDPAKPSGVPSSSHTQGPQFVPQQPMSSHPQQQPQPQRQQPLYPPHSAQAQQQMQQAQYQQLQYAQQHRPSPHMPAPGQDGQQRVTPPANGSLPGSGDGQGAGPQTQFGALRGPLPPGQERPMGPAPGAYGQYRPPLMQRPGAPQSMYVPAQSMGGPLSAQSQQQQQQYQQQQYQYHSLGQSGQPQQPSHQQLYAPPMGSQQLQGGQYAGQNQWNNNAPPVHVQSGPPQVGQVVPQMLLNKGVPKVPRVRNKAPKPGKKALAAMAAAGASAVHGYGMALGVEQSNSPGEQMYITNADGTIKPMTYKEKRAATSKKALAAAAEAERMRNGDIPLREDLKRRETKRERESSIDADGRPDKGEKEESVTALIKRRDPIAARLEEIENSKYLGRKCPPAPLPALAPVLPPLPVVEGKVVVLQPNVVWGGTSVPQKDRRRKTHWDYLLEEVQWMAVDFRQELRWKLAASKSIAQACVTPSSSCAPRAMYGSTKNPANTQHAKSVASLLSRHVTERWAACERVLADQQVASNAVEESVERTIGYGDVSSTSLFDLGKVTERILQAPVLMNADNGEENKGAAAAGGESKTDKHKGARQSKSPSKATAAPPIEPDFPYNLQQHQTAALQKIAGLHKSGLGAILGGRSFVGKTVAVCSLLRKWLAAAPEQASSALVLCVVAPQCLYRWSRQVSACGLGDRFVAWDGSAECTEQLQRGEPVIVAVPTDRLHEFASSPLCSLLSGADAEEKQEDGRMELDGAESVCRHAVTGVVLDLRTCRSSDVLGHNPRDESTSLLGKVSQLAARIASTVSCRCVICEDASPEETPQATLWFLCPTTSIADWQAGYPLGGDGDLHVEQIKRNALSQLIANLSVVMKMSPSADSVVAAQTRVEVLAAEMDITQTQLYNIVVSQVLRHAPIYSGENTQKLARALLLLRRVCFHASLLTFKGEKRLDYVHGLRSAAQLNNLGGSIEQSYDDSSPYDRAALPYRTPTMLAGSQVNAGALWTTAPALSAGMVGPTSSSGMLPGGATGYSVGVMRGSLTGASYRGSSFAAGPASQSSTAAAKIVDHGDLGSCKLVSLRRLVGRFAGLKLVVLIDSSEDLNLVVGALKADGVEHAVAYSSSGNLHECSHGEHVAKWLQTQHAVEEFNSPSTTSAVLLCSKHVFQPPSMTPYQADAVVVLSDDWLRYTEVKDCFRLRLLTAGPTGAPLTVVRVVAAGTIEERMARKGQSFLQLQGTPVVQLYPGLQELQAMTAIPSHHSGLVRTGSGMDLHAAEAQQMLFRAPTLVLIPIVVKSLSNMPRDGSAQNLHSDASGAGSSASANGDPSEHGSEAARGPGADGQFASRPLMKGPAVTLSRPGSTSFGKDQNSSGLTRVRSSIVSPLSGLSSTDPLRQPDAQRWIADLRRDLQEAELSFERRSEAVVITAERDMLAFWPRRGSREGHHRSASAIAVGRHLLNAELGKQGLQGNKGGFVLHHLRMSIADVCSAARWVEDVESVQGAVVTERERRQLAESGLGRTEAERMLGKLILPYRGDPVTPPTEQTKARIESATAEGSRNWPQSFFVFRDLLGDLRRRGIDVDSRLLVNPLQSACRHDTTSYHVGGASAHGTVGDSGMTIKYLHESSRAAASQARTSKPRKPRPSGAASRKKETQPAPVDAEQNAEIKAAQLDIDTAGMNFDMGFLSDLDPMGDSPQKMPRGSAVSSTISSPTVSVGSGSVGQNKVTARSAEPTQDSWHATEDDIIICTQNAFSDPHFKRTEAWLNKALEQAKKRRRTATETRLRYTWLCTTGRTQQRLQDPIVIAQIAQLKSSVASRSGASAALPSPGPGPTAPMSVVEDNEAAQPSN